MVEWTRCLRKFDDIWYTIERVVYTRGELSGFTSEEIYNNLRDKSFFKDGEDVQNFLIEKGKKFRIRPVKGNWERYW
ncbi:MAG: hypothetical protein ACXQT4_01505 [Methanotrichaceae archaeon]